MSRPAGANLAPGALGRSGALGMLLLHELCRDVYELFPSFNAKSSFHSLSGRGSCITPTFF
jgi:hypothetical protein